ncbi:hypothetical protein BCR39DRAFT_138480 [Naematelia encephala]|uniref:Uncharacterized protein n=1 Tax=Naematelia encephala TaxID=71784 RepID=A0A1Y2BJI3_9TREE|nr:hypothetical protein BCR39DRAFT_138480 [Naematelia encephala]
MQQYQPSPYQQQQYAQQAQHHPPSYAQQSQQPHPGMQQQPQSQHPGMGMMMPADLANLAQQGYAAQQAQLAAMAQARGLAGMQAQMAGMQGGSTSHKKKKTQPRPNPAQQMIPRNTAHLAPPHSQDHYIKNAMTLEREPWADGLDEVDGREVAMGRFRLRQEVLAEIFGPERLKDIPNEERDPWEGLGMDGETLEAKANLEKENQELEASMEERLNGWRKQMEAVE